MSTVIADEWMTVDELAAWLKLTREWIYDNVQANKMPYHRLGRQLRFRLSEVEKWLADSASYPVVDDVVSVDEPL